MGICSVSFFGLLCIISLWTSVHTFLGEHMFLILWGTYLRIELRGNMVTNFLRNCQLFSVEAASFSFPSVTCEGSNFFTSSTTHNYLPLSLQFTPKQHGGYGCCDPMQLKNPHITSQFSAYSNSQPQSVELHRSTELWSVEKKKCAYEWTHTAETHVVRGSTVCTVHTSILHVLLYMFLNFIKSIILCISFAACHPAFFCDIPSFSSLILRAMWYSTVCLYHIFYSSSH